MAVACGVGFTAIVTEQGDLWTFGTGGCGMLGLGNCTDQQMPVCVQENDEVFGAEKIITVAAAHQHVACISDKGTLWT